MDQFCCLQKICKEKMAKELPVLRKMNKLTQEDMGEIIGVSRQTVINIENGKTEMNWTVFLALLLIFSFDSNSMAYLKRAEIPFAELKKWLADKRGN